MEILGIDVGGSGIKGALVDTKKGKLRTKRTRYATPQPALPEAVNAKIKKLVKKFDYNGPIGVGFPAIIDNGVVRSAANVADEWINYRGAKSIRKATGCRCCYCPNPGHRNWQWCVCRWATGSQY